MYKYVTTPEDIVLKGNVIGFDTETDGLDIRKNKLLLIQLSDWENTYIIDNRILPKEYVISIFNKYKYATFVAHNSKFDVGMLYSNTGYLLENIFDTMLAEAVLYPGKGTLLKSLKQVIAERFNLEVDKSLQKSFLTPTREFTQEQLEYAAQDVTYLNRIYALQYKEIVEGGFSNVMLLENKLVPVIMKMEYSGVRLDASKLFPVIEREEQRSKEYEQQLFDIAGREFNPRSPKQVKELFHELGRKTNNKNLFIDSTSEDVLKFIKHPLAKILLAYRSSAKIVSTYGIKLIEHIQDDGKIHCNFNQAAAETGRLSSSGPNMQNIPAAAEFRTPFVASEGYKFFTADFSQIELRLAGVVSGEAEILNEYRKEVPDLHRLTAAKMFNIDPEYVTKEQRNHGKTGNFSCLYGSSAMGLATKQDIPLALAERIVESFWSGYPTLSTYKNRIGREALQNGFSRTPLGRIRYFLHPDARDPAYRYKISAIQREGFNMVIQGFAADIMKYALVLVDKALGTSGRLVLTVHDEVGVELVADQAVEMSRLVLDTMEKAGTILVNGVIPMKVEGNLGDCWSK
jgi:DNA polymerase-1